MNRVWWVAALLSAIVVVVACRGVIHKHSGFSHEGRHSDHMRLH